MRFAGCQFHTLALSIECSIPEALFALESVHPAPRMGLYRGLVPAPTPILLIFRSGGVSRVQVRSLRARQRSPPLPFPESPGESRLHGKSQGGAGPALDGAEEAAVRRNPSLNPSFVVDLPSGPHFLGEVG